MTVTKSTLTKAAPIRYRPRRTALLLGAASFMLAACISHLGEEESSIGHVERDCVVSVPPGIESLGPPASLEYVDHSLWIWEALTLSDGQMALAPAAVVEKAEDACSAGPALMVDPAGAPITLLNLTATENEQNSTRTDGKRFALVPLGGFVREGTGYLYYEHVLRGPGVFDAESLGTGLCVLADGATICERVGLPNQTVFFDSTQRVVNHGGLVEADRGLLYGCRAVASLEDVCTITGVPLDRITESVAYQVYDSLNGWQDVLTKGSSIVDELGPLTVFAFRGAYLMSVLDIFDAQVYVRSANSPFGPFGRRIQAFGILPSKSFFPGGGREHAGLRRSPDTIHLSYTTDDPGAPGLHLVTFRVFGNFGE